MKLDYSVKPEDETKVVKAMGRDINMSFKDAVMIADKIRGMKLSKALEYIGKVSELKAAIPYKRFQEDIGHRKGNTPKIAKYPQKAAKYVIGVLKNVQANAEFKGLNPDKMKIIHVQAQKGIGRRRRKPTGRWGAWETQYVHFQV
ncbi:MAG: 50S ribosomal protein L22, partial [Candidatus Altiarchaeota archaeon]|nr:50S ribosomal protein L22 [Candidatus Altiarchaeota archaeon]